MEVINALRSGEHTLESLTSKLGIKVVEGEDLVILNYCQIKSPKTHPIVRECRGLVLEKGTWNCVARAFPRFFNYGEALELNKKFNWSDFTTTTKEDGSLILLYNYKDEWRVNTRGSFANAPITPEGESWAQVFKDAVIINGALDKSKTYVFELCTPWNQVVRVHPTPKAVLLTAFNNETGEEVPFDELNSVCPVRPKQFNFKSIEEVLEYIKRLESIDPTNEGVVLRDCNGLRIKVKNRKYIELHKLSDKLSVTSYDAIALWVVEGEEDELLAYFPLFKPIVVKVKKHIEEVKELLYSTLNLVKDIEDQKEFALAITQRNLPKLSGIFFDLKKQSKLTPEELEKAIKEKRDLFINTLFKKGLYGWDS